MEYKKDVKATYDNSFCMDSECIAHYENMCMRCMSEEGCEIFPDSTISLETRESHLCKAFKEGTFVAYAIDFEEGD